MALQELRNFHDPDLVLTIGGKEYRIPQPSASKGLRIRQLFAAQAIGDATELQHIADILGATWEPNIIDIPVVSPITGEVMLGDDGEPVIEQQDIGRYTGGVWGEMDADGVTWEELMHAGRTALIDVGMGRVVAETHWAQGLAPYIADGGAQGNALPPKPETAEGDRATRRAAAKKTPKKKASSAKKKPAASG